MNILFQSVFMNEENTRRDSIKGCPPTVMLLLEKWPQGRHRDIYFPKHTDPVFAETQTFTDSSAHT